MAKQSEDNADDETPLEKAARYTQMIRDGKIGDGGVERKRRRKERKKEEKKKKKEKKRKVDLDADDREEGGKVAAEGGDSIHQNSSSMISSSSSSSKPADGDAVGQSTAARGSGAEERDGASAAAAAAALAIDGDGDGDGDGGGGSNSGIGEVDLKPLLPPSGWNANQIEGLRPGSKKEASAIAEAVARRDAPLWVRVQGLHGACMVWWIIAGIDGGVCCFCFPPHSLCLAFANKLTASVNRLQL